VFHSKRADGVKILTWDGSGLVLFPRLHQLNREHDGDRALLLSQREAMDKCRHGFPSSNNQSPQTLTHHLIYDLVPGIHVIKRESNQTSGLIGQAPQNATGRSQATTIGINAYKHLPALRAALVCSRQALKFPSTSQYK
jgi:hypothetical protein